MDRALLSDAVKALCRLTEGASHMWIYPKGHSAVVQFESLLALAKSSYPERVDIQAIALPNNQGMVARTTLLDETQRLQTALNLRATGTLGDLVAQIRLPNDVPDGLRADLREFEDAVSGGLAKCALLLAGSMAEALLLTRHYDESDRGPGLKALVEEAKKHKVLGRDTLRQLDTLIDYRDLIHPRSGARTGITPNAARMENAVLSLKLLCVELEDPSARFERAER